MARRAVGGVVGVVLGLAALSSGCANVLGISGYENGDGVEASGLDGAPADVGGEDAADSTSVDADQDTGLLDTRDSASPVDTGTDLGSDTRDSAAADTTVADTTAADTTAADTTVADTTVADTTVPDTTTDVAADSFDAADSRVDVGSDVADAGPTCGNGVKEAGETCDDGNTSTEACPYGMSCSVCDSTCHTAAGAATYCGDTVVNGPEGCDDGAKVVGDGCSGACAIESGYACTGQPSVCTWVSVAALSCAVGGDGINNCGPSGTESCCASPRVTGVTTASFSRSWDGVTSGYTDPKYKAQVSDFRLDKYEITVGRFRKYVAAVVGGWKPSPGSGKHTHLPGGGLNGGAEPGWDATTWNTAANFPTAQATWDGTGYLTHPNCGGYASWTPSAGSNEKKPINCIDWYDAAAFCIWDGGFLPSEAEWNYAAAGGTEQRKYPWGPTEPGANTNLAIYGCYYNGSGSCTGVTNLAPVGTAPAGNGKWGQSDLAGSVWEWNLDWHKSPYNETTCTNCSYLVASSARVFRGGCFNHVATLLLAGYRVNGAPTGRGDNVGARCARTP